MKILQIANKFPYPAKDGGSIATLGLGKSLAELGHEVTILAQNTSKHYFDPAGLPAELAESIRFIGVPVNTDLSIFRLAVNLFFSSLPYNAERFISKDFEMKLTALLEQEKFDIIQLEGLYLAPYLGAIRARSKAKVLMRAHNIEHEIWERTVTRQKGIKKWYIRVLADRIRKMELFYLNRYDAVLPITSRDGRLLQSLGCGLPQHVVPTGVNAQELKPDHRSLNFPSVFHIGALDWIPNQEGLQWFFDEVWGRILEKHPDVKFYLAGRNAPDHFRMLRYRNVIFVGEVDDAYGFIRSRAVMVVPVLSGSGMRIKIIEGMALGKAIVTTSVGTEGIETTHGKDILIADDPVNFAENVCRLIEDQAFCLEIGENARKFVVNEYDNQSISHALMEFYHNLQR